MNKLIRDALMLVSSIVIVYCVMALIDLTTVDASIKQWSCDFGSGKYEKYVIIATGVEEAEVKFQRRFKEISPYVFPSVKCSITK